jgi:predicted transposase YdaD
VLAELRLETLAPVEGSFVDEGLHASSADLLFTVSLRDGGSGFVYVLFEHQSTPDERMPLRLLRYQTRIWERHAAAHPDEPRIPPIVPMLLHHGSKPWPWKPCFSSILAMDDRGLAAIGRNVLGFDFVLDDLACQTDAQILGRAMGAIARLTLVALRSSRNRPRLYEHVASVMQALESELRGPAVIPALARLARYVLEVDDSPPEVVRSAFTAALAREIRSSVMSTADMLRAEGRLEGRLEARRESLLELLEIKFGPVDSDVRARIEQAPLAQVTAWLRRFVVASTVGEVFEV